MFYATTYHRLHWIGLAARIQSKSFFLPILKIVSSYSWWSSRSICFIKGRVRDIESRWRAAGSNYEIGQITIHSKGRNFENNSIKILSLASDPQLEVRGRGLVSKSWLEAAAYGRFLDKKQKRQIFLLSIKEKFTILCRSPIIFIE